MGENFEGIKMEEETLGGIWKDEMLITVLLKRYGEADRQKGHNCYMEKALFTK